MTRLTAILAAAALVALVGGTALFVFLSRDSGTPDRFAQCRETAVAGGMAQIGGPFELTSETGERVTETDVIDGLTLIYFGYTYCPDICPVDLLRNGEAIYALEDRGVTSIEPVFITVDPNRDTVEQMADYTDFMHPRMLGLTGSQEDIDAVIAAYRVFAQRRGDDPENYLMDHSGFTYLMAPDVGLVEVFRRDIGPEAMADRLECFANNL
ncbi:MAG: SCO family protein [Rubricella sp.]